jgi:hypothetical protein
MLKHILYLKYCMFSVMPNSTISFQFLFYANFIFQFLKQDIYKEKIYFIFFEGMF